MVSIEIKKIIREYCEKLCATKLDKLDEMDKLLEAHRLPKLPQEEMENLNRPIMKRWKQLSKPSSKENSRTRWLRRLILPIIYRIINTKK